MSSLLAITERQKQNPASQPLYVLTDAELIDTKPVREMLAQHRDIYSVAIDLEYTTASVIRSFPAYIVDHKHHSYLMNVLAPVNHRKIIVMMGKRESSSKARSAKANSEEESDVCHMLKRFVNQVRRTPPRYCWTSQMLSNESAQPARSITHRIIR